MLRLRCLLLRIKIFLLSSVSSHRVDQQLRVQIHFFLRCVTFRNDCVTERFHGVQNVYPLLKKNAMRLDGFRDLTLERDLLLGIGRVQSRHEVEPGGVVLPSRFR